MREREWFEIQSLDDGVDVEVSGLFVVVLFVVMVVVLFVVLAVFVDVSREAFDSVGRSQQGHMCLLRGVRVGGILWNNTKGQGDAVCAVLEGLGHDASDFFGAFFLAY